VPCTATVAAVADCGDCCGLLLQLRSSMSSKRRMLSCLTRQHVGPWMTTWSEYPAPFLHICACKSAQVSTSSIGRHPAPDGLPVRWCNHMRFSTTICSSVSLAPSGSLTALLPYVVQGPGTPGEAARAAGCQASEAAAGVGEEGAGGRQDTQ
jgi:hypothetical protein